MSNIIPASKQDQSGHYYDMEGIAVEGGLRVARACRAFPSVTTCMSIAKNYAIERYKRENFGLALLTTPRIRGESDEAFLARADEGSTEASTKAMEKGTHIHKLWENIEEIRPKLKEECELDQKRCQLFLDWKDENVLKVEASESVVISKEFGFAGRFDCLVRLKDGTKAGERLLIDLKTGAPKDGKLTAWDSYALQLSAYVIAFGEKVPTANLMFSSTDEVQIKLVRYTEEQMDRARPAFLGILKYWQWANKYWPHTDGNTNVP